MADLYVCNVMGDMLYPLEDIEKSNISLHRLLNGQWELSFTYTKGKDTLSPAFDSLEEGMYIFLEENGWFKMRQPAFRIDAATESKTIQAYSCEVELEDHVVTFPVNMGTETSLEFLVEYDYTPVNAPSNSNPHQEEWYERKGGKYVKTDDETVTSGKTYYTGEDELVVNPYTGIPYDWIVLYNTYPQQLTKLQHILDNIWQDKENPCVIASDAADFEYINGLLTLIPRLVSRASEVSNGVLDAITVVEATGDHTMEPTYELVQYATLTKDRDGETTAITLDPTFIGRVEYLKEYYTKYGRQLSLLDILSDEMDNTWAPGDIYGYDPNDIDGSDYTLCNQRYQFEIDETIYSFLTSTYAQRVKCVVTFDRMQRRINVTPVEHVGEETGITLSYDQLLNTLDITTNEDTLATRITVHGSDSLTSDKLSLEQVNFGSDQIVDIDYKLNARDRNGRRIYVSDELAEKYARYKEYRENTARPAYVEKSKEINALQKEISDLKYRVPADSMQNDWDTFSDEELDGQLKNYSNLLYALQELYAEDYGYTYLPSNNVNTPWVKITEEQYDFPEWLTVTSESDMIPRIEFIRNTIYWWDFVAYRQTITQILVAMQARYDSDVKYSIKEIPETNQWYDQINAWKTQWDLYGTVEMQNKIASYTGQLQTMIDGDAICVVHKSWDNLTPEEKACLRDETGAEFDLACMVLQKRKTWDKITEEDRKYFTDWRFSSTSYITLCNAGIITWEAIPWDELSDSQKALHGNIETGYFYQDYKKIYDLRNEAQEYLDGLQSEIDEKEKVLNDLQDVRADMADVVKLSEYVSPINGESFTKYEQQVINLLYRDSEYTNDYILATSLDDTVTALDRMEELYEDGVEKASIFSRPQLTFTADVDNLLALEEFAPWREQFKLGNYIYIEYRDGSYVRLRVVGVTYNPCLNTGGMTMEFSTLTYSKTNVTDIESVLGSASPTTSSGGSSSGGGGGGGQYGDLSDIGITLSDTMLKKLLTKESFNKEVSESVMDAMKQQTSMSKIAVFQGLKDGVTDVSGDCIRTGRIASTETCEVTYWTPFYKLPTNLQRTFGNFRDTEYTEAIPMLQLFINQYGGSWGDLTAAERQDRVERFWNGRTEYQKSLFSHSSTGATPQSVFLTLLSDENRNSVYTTDDNRPVSDLALNDGAFSYGGGNLKYGYDAESIQYIYDIVDGYFDGHDFYESYDATTNTYSGKLGLRTQAIYRDKLTSRTYRPTDDPVQGRILVEITGIATQEDNAWAPILFMRGRIEASEGSIGGVKVAKRSAAPNGVFTLHDDGITMETPVEQLRLWMNDGQGNTSIWGDSSMTDIIHMHIKHPLDGQSGQNFDYLWMGTDHFAIGQNRPTGAYNGTDQESILLRKDGYLRVTNKIESCGSISADGAISSGGGMIATSTTNQGSGASSGTHVFSITGAGSNPTLRLSGSGTAPKSNENESTSNKSIKAKYDDNTYAALYSNGNIWATHYIRGQAVFAGTTRLGGADYAELFEWQDGNPDDEDRRGLFVTLDGDKIRLANSDDDYILGIVSALPSVAGNTAFDQWHDKYLTDEFGSILYEPIEHPDELDEEGNVVKEAYTEYAPIINPEYDETREYIPREDRPEWSPIGLVGQLVMVDDGTCEVNGFATSADEGIATKADGVTQYRVIKRINENHIVVAAK